MKTLSIHGKKWSVLLAGLAIVTTLHTASAQGYGPGRGYAPNGYGYQNYGNPPRGYVRGGYYGPYAYSRQPNVVVVAPPVVVVPPPVVVVRPPIVVQGPRFRAYRGGRGRRW